MPASTNPLAAYAKLQSIFYRDVRGAATRRAIEDCFVASAKFLAGTSRTPLRTPTRSRQLASSQRETLSHESVSPGKTYFAFAQFGKISRAVNRGLYSKPSVTKWRKLTAALDRGDLSASGMSPEEITKLVYSIAVAFCCAIDLLKQGDQQRPGTFFAYLISHLVASMLRVNPERELPLVNVEVESHLPTDFTFNVPNGRGRRRKFHLPIKTSTRERAIQIFAHQAMLNNAYGQRIFAAIPVILGETKSDRSKREVIEICLPIQWQLYQRHLAHLARVYYLDVPDAYRKLNSARPPIIVKEFGEFFFEVDELTP